MIYKSNSSDDLQPLFIREFPEYSSVFNQLLNHKDFIEILNDFRSCELALSQINKTIETIDCYKEMMLELKHELRSCIARHLGSKNLNT